MACPNGHPLTLDDLEPRTFSFNSPYGACPECTGIGMKKEVDPELVVPDPELSLADGAIAPWAGGQSAEYFGRLLDGLASAVGFRTDVPWRRLSAAAQKAVLHGTTDQVHVRYRNRYGRERSYYANFEGVIPFLDRRLDQTDSEYAREKYEGYMRDVPCPACKGARLKPEVLAVTLAHRDQGEKSIAEVSAMSVADCSAFLDGHAARRPPGRDRRAGAQGGAGPAGLPARRRAALPVAGPRRGHAVRAARRSGSGSPRRSAPGWSACSTCWTSRRSGCTSATTAG